MAQHAGEWRRRLFVAGALQVGRLVLVLLGVTVAIHALVALAPGSAADAVAGSAEERAALQAAWGEDQPVVTQVVQGVSATLRGDLGESHVVRPGAPVASLAATAWRASTARLLAAASVALLLALVVGLRGGPGRVTTAASAGPVVLLAVLLVHGINAITWRLLQAGWIDRPAWFALPDQDGLAREALGIVILAVASGSLAELSADVAAAVRGVREAPWADAVRARGASLAPHLALHLVAPVSGALGARLLLFGGGLVVLEKVLLLPGAGSLLWRAAIERDLALAAGLVLVGAALLGTLRLLLEGAARVADPRLASAP